MIKMIIKEKFGDMVYNLIYIFLIIINVSVIFLLSLAGGLLKKIHNSRWFSEEIYLQSTQDAFFAEKFKMVYNVSTLFILIAQIVLSIILLYIIMSHINKWKMDIALLYTLGYAEKNMFFYLCIRNLTDTVFATLISGIAAALIWKTIILDKLFNPIIDRSGVEYEINYLRFIIICLCVFAVQMIISIVNYKKQKQKNIRNVVED